jgi:hypothetical protein
MRADLRERSVLAARIVVGATGGIAGLPGRMAVDVVLEPAAGVLRFFRRSVLDEIYKYIPALAILTETVVRALVRRAGRACRAWPPRGQESKQVAESDTAVEIEVAQTQDALPVARAPIRKEPEQIRKTDGSVLVQIGGTVSDWNEKPRKMLINRQVKLRVDDDPALVIDVVRLRKLLVEAARVRDQRLQIVTRPRRSISSTTECSFRPSHPTRRPADHRGCSEPRHGFRYRSVRWASNRRGLRTPLQESARSAPVSHSHPRGRSVRFSRSPLRFQPH